MSIGETLMPDSIQNTNNSLLHSDFASNSSIFLHFVLGAQDPVLMAFPFDYPQKSAILILEV